MAEKTIVIAPELGDFFRERVEEGCRALSAPLDEQLRFYLVALCHDFARAGSHMPAVGSEPLALMRHRAHELPRQAKMNVLKQLGDLALYTAGFFAEFVARSVVDIPYYVAMGQSAYRDLGGLSDPGGRRARQMRHYHLLAENFVTCVDVLAQVRGGGVIKEDVDTLRLFERWTKTGSTMDRRALIARGLTPTDAPDTHLMQ